MDIFIDDLIFSLQQAGGISVYWSELMKRMNAVTNKHVVTCISTQGHQNILAEKINWQHPTIADNSLPIQAKRFLPLLKKLPAKSIFHSSYLRWCWQKDVVNILTIHDLAPEKGLINGKAKYIRQLQQRIALQHADGVLCVSETIRKDLLNHYTFLQPEKVKAVYHGVSDAFYSTGQKERTQPFVLFVGHRSGYKNFSLAVDVVSAIPNMQMMVVGGKQLTAQEHDLLNKKLANRFVFKATVDIQELNNLYNHAFCLLYPSAYEGFGLPIAEAMKVGCPVVTTNKAAIPEVAGNGALQVKELTVDAFVEAIQSLQHQAVRNHLLEHGQKQAMNFSWDNCYNQTMAFYQTIWQAKFG